MHLHDNIYSAFMLDYAAGALPPAERLAADLHRTLSTHGRRNAAVLDAVGGAFLERAKGESLAKSSVNSIPERAPEDRAAAPVDPRLVRFINTDLISLPWRRNLFGVMTLRTDLPLANLLRLDPGERAPQHGHGRRDVTVVLVGTFADEFGVYERGDLAFAEPGMKHEPRAVGDKPCVCLIAAEPGRPLLGFLGMFGFGAGKMKDAA